MFKEQKLSNCMSNEYSIVSLILFLLSFSSSPGILFTNPFFTNYYYYYCTKTKQNSGPQGGAFDKDINYFRTILGSHTLIPGVESALRTMKVGGIRQVIVPYGPLSYPSNTDLKHEVVGPKPTTFSGMRALNFVLENERVDRTLLFNVKLVRVDRSDGRGGFTRGGSGDSP